MLFGTNLWGKESIYIDKNSERAVFSRNAFGSILAFAMATHNLYYMK